MRIVLAPDSFKGSADAGEVASALARGWRRERPGDEILLRPMADGGEGTLDAFETAVPGAVRHRLSVTGPLGRPVDASWLMLPDASAVVELAATSGITLLAPDELRAQDATTRGFGEAIAAALAGGATRLLLAVGSSCSTDGGAGALQALGAVLTDAAGDPIGPGGRGLASVAAVDLTGMPALPARGAVIVSDVSNPLLGPTGAAAVFGPQKGATAADVVAMDAALAGFAALLRVEADTPGAGAAGGTAFGLLAWGATLAPGAAVVAEALGLTFSLTGSPGEVVVVTGEGRFDEQSAGGKVPSFVARLAAGAGARALLVAGSIDAPTTDFTAAVSLSVVAGSSARAMAEPLDALEEAGSSLAATTIPPLEQLRDDVWSLGLAMDGDHLPFSLLYLLRDSDGGLHIIDPGTDLDSNFDVLARALASLGATLADIRSITATHLHPDHLGMADRVRLASGAILQVSAREAEALERLGELRLSAGDVAALAERWGVPADRRDELLAAAGRAPDYPAPSIDRLLNDGDVLDIPGFEIRVVSTPGHTPGHLCLVDRARGFVLSGDHILPTIFAGLGLGGPTATNALADYLVSCERIAAEGDLEVLPGHGHRFRGLAARADESAAHHLTRTHEVEAALAADPDASIWAIASQLTWTAGWQNLAGFFVFSALSQTEMHRDYLRRRA